MRYTEFAGLLPKQKPEGLSTAYAQAAENLDLYRGELLPLRAPATLGPIVDVTGQPTIGTPESLFYVNGITIGWPRFTWVTRDPRAYPGDDAFIYAEGGAMYWQSVNRLLAHRAPVRMGVCRPSEKGTATILMGQGCAQLATPLACVPGTGACPEIPPDPRAYVFCWVKDYPECHGRHEQSPPSPPLFVTTQDADAVVLSTPTPPADVTRVFWYRWVASSKGDAVPLFVGEAPVGAPFVDTACPGDLGHALPSARWFEPPCNIEGVASAGDNSVVVWSGHRLWISEPRLPHAFDHDVGVRILDTNIVGIIAQIQRREQSITYELHIATEGRPYVAMGATPEKTEVRMINEDAPCVSKRSIVDMTAGRTGWATPLGFSSTTGDRMVSETDAFFTDNEWGQIHPSSLLAFYFNERVWMFGERGGLVLGIPSEGGQRPRSLTTTSLPIAAAAQRIGHPPVVAQVGSETAFEFLRGAPMEFTWRSEETVFAGLWMPAAAKIVARRVEVPRHIAPLKARLDAWTARNPGHDPSAFVLGDCELAPYAAVLLGLSCVRMRIWREGQPSSWQLVGLDRPFRLRRLPRALRWSIEVKASIPVIEVHYNTGIADLALEGGNQ